MGDKHLDTIPKTELHVENLVSIPSESEVTSNNESECDVPVNDESSPIFTTFSNPLFDSNDDFTSSDDESLSNEDVPMKNFKIYSNPLLLMKKSFLQRLEEICLIENLLYENSSPEEHNSEIADTIIESLSPPPIPVEDSDSLMEEIDLFLAFDDLMPPGIENDDHDSEGDIRFREELLRNNSPPFPKNESFSLDHFDDPSFPRPPLEPPDVEICFNFEPDAGDFINKVVGDISKHDVSIFLSIF
ncbi:hypothetical protein Tco_1048091 [Tanacetum coccineum]